ncbi:rhomboid family intramembrane serine protease [Tellurirhabdus bombi]|uniref:rhomboid family intramembrane serine protease n=1 Tax=Tellurirhabdus bombi TaxID=2907205 RepID=UPI00286DE1C2|nr:rhomboid family intramembrane serine protease [Tellurirhabdus bombi]
MMLTPVVRTMLLVNVALFLITAFGINLTYNFALYSFLSPAFQPYQLVSYMFLHANFNHVFSNMLGLFFFGPLLEQVWGSKKFTFFYFFTGIGAGALFAAINYYEISHFRDAIAAYTAAPTPDGFLYLVKDHAPGLYEQLFDFINQFEDNSSNPTYIQNSIKIVNSYYLQQVNIPMVGASGAVFGILMAFGLLFPNTELFLLFLPIPIKAKYLVAFYGAYEIYSGVYRAQTDGVAHFAHIGGMLFAYILVRYWGTQRKNFY